MSDFCETTATTIVLFTMDYVLEQTRDFILRGWTELRKPQVLRLVGDDTHQQSDQDLKKTAIGFSGIHFDHGEWSTTFLPVM